VVIEVPGAAPWTVGRCLLEAWGAAGPGMCGRSWRRVACNAAECSRGSRRPDPRGERPVRSDAGEKECPIANGIPALWDVVAHKLLLMALPTDRVKLA